MLKSVQLSNVDLNLLVLFDAVWRERNVARAAVELSLSPSAVSHGLGRLRRLFSDPLFLRIPKGVVPTARALELAEPIAAILARVTEVVAVGTPFDPLTSERRFGLGMADASAAALLPALLTHVRRAAPRVDLAVRHLLPSGALEQLEARSVDVAVVALDAVAPRFAARTLFEEDFVIAARAGHPFLKDPSLKRYCTCGHALVSLSGDAHGFVDDALSQRGLSRRVALVVSSFMLALTVLPDSELLTALPRGLAVSQGPRFGVEYVAPPLPLPRYELRAVTLRSALSDAGVSWLVESVAALGQVGTRGRRGNSRRTRALPPSPRIV